MKNIVLAVCSTFILLSPHVGSIQAQNSTNQKVVKSPEEVASIIAQQGRAVSLRSKMEMKIEKKDPVYQFSEGESRAVLLKLPAYTKPYELKIFSCEVGFQNGYSFLPIIVALDSQFAQQGVGKVEFSNADGKKKRVFQAEINVDDAWSKVEYLLFYTDPKHVGEELGRFKGGTTTVSTGNYRMTGVPVLPAISRIGAHGRLQFEVGQR